MLASATTCLAALAGLVLPGASVSHSAHEKLQPDVPSLLHPKPPPGRSSC